MRKSFHFVQIQTNEKQNEGKYKKEVHVQAMRAYRRQERAQRTSQYQKRIAADASVASDEFQEDFSSHKSSLPMVATGLNTPIQNMLPSIDQSAHLATNTLDPFSTLSFELGADQQILLRHFQTTMASILLPGTAHGSKDSFGSRWLEASIEHPTLLLATCAHSSAHLDMVTQGRYSQQTFKLLATAIRALNQALDTGVSDSTLGAVAMIAGNALLPDDTREFEHLHIHVNALLKMVSLRGGIHHIGSGRFRCALQLGMNLLFGPYEILSQCSHDLEPIMAMLPNALCHLRSTRDLLAECRHLTEIQTQIESTTEVDITLLQRFSDRRSALEVYLGRCLRRSSAIENTEHGYKSIERAVVLAAVLFTICILRSFHAGHILTAAAQKEVIETVLLLLDSDSSYALENIDAPYLLWSTLLAYKFSEQDVWPSEFPGMLCRLLSHLQLRDMSQVNEALGQVAWSERIWTLRMRSLLGSVGVH